jgi:hypothetical protein
VVTYSNCILEGTAACTNCTTTTTSTTTTQCPDPPNCPEGGGVGTTGYLCYGITEEIATGCGDQQVFRYNTCEGNTFWIGQEIRALPAPFCNSAPDGWYCDQFRAGNNVAHLVNSVVVYVTHF